MINKIKKYFMFRTYFPKGLMGRILILIILPLFLSQALTGYIFYKRHWKNISNQNALTFGGNVLTLVEEKDKDKTAEEFIKTQDMAKNFSMNAEWFEGAKIQKQKNSERLEKLSLRYVYKFLNQNIKMPYSLIADENTNSLKMEIQYPDGVLKITSSLKSIFSKTFYIFFLWVLGGLIIFSLIAIPFAKNQVDSIKKLTDTINTAGRGEEIKNFKPSGAVQIKKAGQAFLKTYTRMQRHFKSRTSMLSGISHDLKTPLTRMKLELEFCDDKNLQFALLNDIEDMEKMIDAYLNFARGVGKEESVKTNITKMMQNLIRKLNKGNFDISFSSSKDFSAIVRPFALERAISNIIMNAIRYGDKKINISIKQIDENLEIIIEDNGQGIPKEKREDMFKPFTKLDNSRNTEVGGVGLGLSIVQEIIHQHGGEITLLDSKKFGGLLVKIELPLK